MKYDFTSILQRAGHDAIAVDLPTNYKGTFEGVIREEGFDVIPMWIADMNFPVVPKIQEEISKRLAHPTFGYFEAREEYYNAIINWQKSRNHLELTKENIGYENGVLGGVVSAMKVFASNGDNVLVHSPTYIGFTMSLENNGYHIIHSPLKKENDTWVMDYEDMEKKIKENHIHVAIVCNPHNPCGRAWSKEELEKAALLFEKYQVSIICDEIWSDIILDNNTHVPFININDYTKQNTIALYAPSKTFNLAGLIGAYHIIYNPLLIDRHNKEASLSHYNNMNVLSMYGLIGAYSKDGEEWLEELKEVLSNNIQYAYDFITNNFHGVSLIKPEATYMLYIDCEQYVKDHNITLDELLHRGWKYGVYWQDGRPFHKEYAIRMNLALPLEKVKEAFDRLQEYVFI